MIIANMIGRNEADRYLPLVLDRLSKQVDVICFTDDCSDDDTIEVANSFWRVHTQKTPEPMFETNEGALRTFAWRFLEQVARPGDWVLSIDCDELLYCPEDSTLDVLLHQDKYDILGIVFFHMWNETHYRTDKAWAPNVSTRLFRYQEGGVFKQRKLACGAEPTYVEQAVRQGRFFPSQVLRMKHLGYMKDSDKQMKYERYMRLDGGNFHSLSHLESILDPEPTLESWPEWLL